MGRWSYLRSWPWWLHTGVVSLLLGSSSSLSSCSIVAAAFHCRHGQGSRSICLCAAVSWVHWWIQQYEPLGREEGKFFRRASYLQLNLSRVVRFREGGRRCFQQTNNRKLTYSDRLQWGVCMGVWVASLVGCLLLLLCFHCYIWRSLLCRPVARSGGGGNINGRNRFGLMCWPDL